MYATMTSGISGCKINVTSSWKIRTELVHPMGRVTSLNAPDGV